MSALTAAEARAELLRWIADLHRPVTIGEIRRRCPAVQGLSKKALQQDLIKLRTRGRIAVQRVVAGGHVHNVYTATTPRSRQ